MAFTLFMHQHSYIETRIRFSGRWFRPKMWRYGGKLYPAGVWFRFGPIMLAFEYARKGQHRNR